MLYKSFVRWDEKGGGDREVIAKCIRKEVRTLYPSQNCMGHTKKSRKKKPLQVTNMVGKVTEGVWWVYENRKWLTKELVHLTVDDEEESKK